MKKPEDVSGDDRTAVGTLKQPASRSASAMFQNGLSLLIVTFFLSACASYLKPDTNPNDPQSVTRAIRVERDEFKKITRYTGPNASDYPNVVFIRATKPDNEGISYQIYVRDQYDGGWRYYNSAYDSNGTRLDTTVIDREVLTCKGHCVYWEHLGLNVSRDYLEKNQQRGIRFKISGKGGEEVYFVPSAYISAVLSAVK